jgi:hypothetical protein
MADPWGEGAAGEDDPGPAVSAEDVWGGPMRGLAPSARARRRRGPKGNVKAGEAGAARAAALAEATGRAQPERSDWRDQLGQGNRPAAEAALRSRAPTHNAGRGFGLA